MRIRLFHQVVLVLIAVVIVGFCPTDAGAQRRRKRSSRPAPRRVVTTPATETEAGTAPDDPTIVSTADQTASAGDIKGTKLKQKSTSTAAPTPSPESEQEALRRSIGELAGQVTKLTEKLNQMEEQQRSLVEIERLSRAEQRAEGLRAQLRDVQAKETDLQAQLDQLEYALQPESIERAVAMYGTTRPEVARDQRRRQLENQRSKVRDQFNQMEQSRVKLEAAIATADTEVETLRQRIEASQLQTNQPATPTLPPVKTPEYTPPPQLP